VRIDDGRGNYRGWNLTCISGLRAGDYAHLSLSLSLSLSFFLSAILWIESALKRPKRPRKESEEFKFHDERSSRTSADFSLASLRDPRSAIESLGKPDRPDEPVPEIGPRFRKRSHQASLSRARDRYRSRFSQDTSLSAFSRFQVRAISMIAITES